MAQTFEEPFYPRRDIHRPFLRLLKNVVIGSPLLADLRRHAIEPLWAVLGTGESHVRNGARNTAVTVFERMDGHKPEVCQACFQNGIDVAISVEPRQERLHVAIETCCLGRLEMEMILTDRARDGASRPSPHSPFPHNFRLLNLAAADASGRWGRPCR